MTFKRFEIAFCAGIALLCASCATGPTEREKSPKELAELYTNLGTQALMRGDYPQAIEDLRKALTADSKNPIAHNHLGLAYFSLGKKELARAEINQAIENNPQYSDAYVNLGTMALEERNYALAKKYYRRALDNLEYKMRHRALTNLAQIEFHENNLDEARRLAYQSLQANPDYCMSHFVLGSIFMRESRPKKAAEEFKKSILSSCARNVEGHYQLGLSYMKAREFIKARGQFVHIIEEFPQTVRAQQAGDLLKDIP